VNPELVVYEKDGIPVNTNQEMGSIDHTYVASETLSCVQFDCSLKLQVEMFRLFPFNTTRNGNDRYR
jgi:hypothetical protein